MSKIIKYTDEQKREVIAFVESYNAANGRGGQSTAAAKFGISQLTVAGWLKAAGNTSLAPVAPKKAKASTKAQDVEIVGPSWDRARDILGKIKLAIRVSLAGQVLLGKELLDLKILHGFLGSGRRKEKPQVAVFNSDEASLNRSWEDWCKSELGISDDTADRFIGCYEGAKAKLKRLGGEARLLTLMDTPPSKLDAEGHKTLEQAASKICDGESQKSLLEEFKMVKVHDSTQIGGDTSTKKAKVKDADRKNMAALAAVFFKPLTKNLHNLTTNPDRDGYYAVMAETAPDQLATLEQLLDSSLTEVRAAKAKRTKGTVTVEEPILDLDV